MKRRPRSRRSTAIFLTALLATSLGVVIPVALISQPQPAYAAGVSTGDIAYVVQPSNGTDPYTLNVRHTDGSIVQLADLTADDTAVNPAPSPDGSQVAFDSRLRGKQTTEIYVSNSDGSGRVRLTTSPDTNDASHTMFTDWFPSWCGKQTVLFQRQYVTNLDPGQAEFNNPTPERIYKVNVDGSGEIKVSLDNSKQYLEPECSPDGTKITFSRYNASTMQYELWYMNVNGTGETKIPNQPASRDNDQPTWGSNSRIFFHSFQFGSSVIYGLNISGTSLTQVTPSDGQDPQDPSVSGDGNTVLYWKGDGNLYTISSAGGGTPVQIPNTAGYKVNAQYFKATYPTSAPSNAAVALNTPSPKDAYGTHALTIKLSSTGVSKWQYGWSQSSSTAPSTTYLQETTDVTGKTGKLSFLGKYSGSGTTWNGGTQPDQDWYLWIRPVTTSGVAGSWDSNKLKVHTPKAGRMIGVGDSYLSGHHQDSDERYCPLQTEVDWYPGGLCLINGAPHLYPNDYSFSWLVKAATKVNATLHLAPSWQVTTANYALSGAGTNTFGSPTAGAGTDAWADNGTQVGGMRAELYQRQDSWNYVALTGGADDTSWVQSMTQWYQNHFTSSYAPWNVTSAAECPDTTTVYNDLVNRLNPSIKTNLQGVITVATRYSSGVRVLNTGYPYPLDNSNICYADNGGNFGAHSVINMLNVDHQQITGSNVRYVDLVPSFGNTPVTSNYLQLARLYGYPHPSDTGQNLIATQAAAVATSTTSW